MLKVFETPIALLGTEGTQLGPTEWMKIEQSRIDGFADSTDDHQWIHVDRDRAVTGPYGTTIAHGFLTLSLVNRFLPELIEVRGFKHAVNVGCDGVRFLNVVKEGALIRGVGEIVAVEEKKGAIQSRVKVTVEIEGEERPACVVETISRYFPEDA
mgnify:CR=1 FL=1